MGNTNGERSPLPPYIPFKTIDGFIKKLNETAIPERVDLSLLRTYSGSTARQIIAALKYLGLIDENQQTTDNLRRLVKAYGTDGWQATLGEIMSQGFDGVVSGLNLDTATPSQLSERFKLAGADGQVQQKCIAFYVGAMKAAGVTISPHIISRQTGRTERTRSKPRGKRQDTIDEGAEFRDPAATIPSAPGTVRFSFPIPGKASATVVLPEDLATEDLEIIDTMSLMVKAYVQRREKAEKKGE